MSGDLVTAGSAAARRGRPPLYGDLRRWGLVQADALWLLSELPSASVDAIVTDPPYGLNFNNQAWDGGALADGLGYQTFTRAWADQASRVLKPGGYLACLGASRTMHRAVAGIEDAGLDIRDQLLWLYGSGVPKSRLMAGGLGSALKPAYEPILLARAPLNPGARTLSAHVEAHGTGALNIDDTRLVQQRYRNPTTGELVGRWPANIALGHDPDCGNVCRTDCVVAELDHANPETRPSRFFWAAKTSRAEREAGLELHPKRRSPILSGSGSQPRANVHPTVKPIALMRWLVRLVVPSGGLVLDPFAGSGSTGIAAVLEGRQFVGIERESGYVDIARARIAHWAGQAAAEPGR
jgi:site-specific DNA-methyltransferase (adenine-specific)